MKKTNFDKNQNMYQVGIDSVNKKGFNGNHIVRTLQCQVFKLPADTTKTAKNLIFPILIIPSLKKVTYRIKSPGIEPSVE
jgi:hypothetical protein